jgi:hypothetical protein
VKNYIKVSKADAGCETTKEHGGSWIKKKILAIYSTRAQALEHKIRLHKRLDVKNNDAFLNQANVSLYLSTKLPSTSATSTSYHKIKCVECRLGR